jgi:hypothetical protein
MNRSGNILFCLCTALLLVVGDGRAETVFWSDNFDDAGAGSRWNASTPNVWNIGSPTAGPAKNSSGYRTHSGVNCASTQNYAYNDSRLICINYNGASSLVVPSADQFPRLRFWHWFNFGNALGFVEISTDAGATWQQISPTYIYDDTATSGGVWSRPSIDLSAYAGQSVQIAFHFAGLCCGNGLGWYVDDVAVVTGEPVFNNPEGFESGAGDWAVDTGTWEIGKPTSGPNAAHGGTNCAATILAGNYPNNVDTRLISPPFLVPANSPALRFWHWYNFNNALGFVEISTDGSTWNQLSPTYQNGNTGWNNVSLDLSAYAGQTVQAAFHFASGGIGTAAGWYVDDISLVAPPTLTVPPTQTIYAGQTLDVTLSATNSLFPTNALTFALVSPPKTFTNLNLNPVTGELTWTSTPAQPPSTNTIYVKVTDAVLPFLSATNSFIVQVLWPYPVLTVPPTQTIYAGQTLIVTNYATNSVYPDATFTFALLSGPTNMDVSDLPTDGVLQWVTTTNQRAGNYTNVVTVVDSVSLLSATNRFVIVVSNPPPPTLIVPPKQTIFAGQTLTVTNSATSVYPGSTFTFALLSGPAGVNLDPNAGVLTWATTTAQRAGNYTNVVTVLDSVSLLSATNRFVIVVSNPLPPTLIVPPKQTIFAGQTLIVTNYATSVYPSSTFTFALLSGLTNVEANLNVSDLTNNGVLQWATTTKLPSGNYTNVVTVLDSVSLLSATNSFVIVVSNPPPPTLIVPPTQTIYAGQTLIVTNYATSVYPSSTFTFALLSGPKNVDVSNLPMNGVLRWATTTAQPAGNYTNVVTVLDSVSLLSATNRFVVVVSTNPPPPTLIVPPTQTIYAGQTLIVTNYAYYTNSAFPSSAFTFATNPPTPTGVNLNTNTGVLSWATTTAQPAGTYTNVITVMDSLSHLSATSNFLVLVLPPLPPTLIVPPTQLIYAGQTLDVTISATNSAYPGSTFTFVAFGPTNMDVSNLPKNGVLKWTPLAAQAPSANTIYVKVTDNNSLSTISNFLVLVVTTPPPGFTVSPAQTLPVNGFQFTLNTMPDTTWRIDASTNLSSWLPLLTNTADLGGTLQVTDLLATNYLRRFYRAVLP